MRAHFSDPDGDALRYSVSSADTLVARAAVAADTLVVVTGAGRGSARVTVTARDPGRLQAVQSFTVTVPNSAPMAVGTLGAVTVHKGGADTVQVAGAFHDLDGDALTFAAASSDTAVAAVRVSGSQLTVTGVSQGGGRVTVTASDGHGGTAEQVFEVTVANRAPERVGTIGAQAVEGGAGGSVEVAAYFSDPDGDALSYTVSSSDTAVATVTVTADEVAYAGVSAGEAVVTVTASDGHGGSAAQTFTVTVRPPNRAPVFGAASYEREVAENSAAGTAVGGPAAATDADSDTLAYRLVGGGAQFAVDSVTGQITVAEGAVLNYESGDTLHALNVEASDGDLADTAAVTVRVTDVPAPGKPDAPVVTGGTGEVTATWVAPANEGPEITDYDLRYRARGDTAWTELLGLGAVLADTVAGLEAGTTYQIQVRAKSSEGAGAWSEPGEGTTAAPPNRAPLFGASSYEREVAENSAAGTGVGGPVAATDADGDTLAYRLVAGGALFAVDSATGQITVAEGAALNYESGDTLHALSVEASDGELADTAAVTVRVWNADDPGKLTLSVAVARVGVEITATLMDEDGSKKQGKQRRWQRSDDGASWTNIASATGRTYAPVPADAGKRLRAVFTYADGHGPNKQAQSAAVTVEVPNRAPLFGASSYEREVAENSAAGTAVGGPAAATDADGDTLAYRLVGGGAVRGIPRRGRSRWPRVRLNYESDDTRTR